MERPGGVSGNGNVFAARRGSTGWHSRSLVPPTGEQVGEGGLRYELALANPSFDSFVFKVSSGVVSKDDTYIVRVNSDGSQDVLLTEPGGFDATAGYAEVRASDDLSHVYFNARATIDPSHVPGRNNVYDIGSGTPELVSRMPGTDEAPPCGTFLGSGPSDFAGSGYEWVSTDPTAPARAYFEVTSDPVCFGTADRNVYLRDLDAGTTTLVSGPPISGPARDSRFIRASADGSRAIFVSSTKLSPDDSNDTSDLYRFAVGSGNECLTCGFEEAKVWVNAGGFDRHVAVSDDLSRVVFLSPRRLIPGLGVAEQKNIYLWHEGEVEFLGIQDGSGAYSERMSIAMTPGDGKVVVFATAATGITADDTGGLFQFYRYDAVAKSTECVTCPRNRPATAQAGGFYNAGYLAPVGGITTLSADGSTFAFQTAEPLDPRDVNQEDDIYVWRNGRVRIVTDGVTKYPVSFFAGLKLLGISPDGMDVLFSSGINLTGWERDHVGQLYTAHVGGGFATSSTTAGALRRRRLPGRAGDGSRPRCVRAAPASRGPATSPLRRRGSAALPASARSNSAASPLREQETRRQTAALPTHYPQAWLRPR